VFHLEPRTRCERVNRIVNLSLAILLSLVLVPLFAVIAVAIKLSSPGPVLYTQTRVGLDRRWRRKISREQRRTQDLGGQPFAIYKFRSMRLDAETTTGAVWATTNDPRVTPIGSVLRKYHIDEIPQLINVIRGEMNFVGPRPERPIIVARLRENIDEYPLRHRVKPGITGLAQITQRYDSCLDDVRRKVSYDVQYLGRQSLWLDFVILLRTAPAVLTNRQS
jgi:lipopolysaccharide/colanic/teichoic acid biosynthesis glycosyltransferase